LERRARRFSVSRAIRRFPCEDGGAARLRRPDTCAFRRGPRSRAAIEIRLDPGRSLLDPFRRDDYAAVQMPSFDIVSKPNWSEIDNALNQAQKELAQRFDFKDTGTELEKTSDGIHVASATDDRVRAALSVLQDKLVKRKVALRFLDPGKIERGPKGTARMLVKVKEGIAVEVAREIVKLIKDQKLKVQGAIHETQVRITGKNKDDLQACIQSVRATDFGVELQFVNFRD
jgi:uncharacterized protein YajQ (UPF0234 family)